MTESRPPVLQSLEFLLGIMFDARRAVYFREHGILAIADLHLGYAWAHRARGQLLPILPSDDALKRLKNLLEDYKPRRLVLLGDIVHNAVPVPALLDELKALLELHPEIVLLTGNHDRELARLLNDLNSTHVLQSDFSAGENLFLHGDRSPRRSAARYIIGHEHPAISLGDGVATSRKFPCFLIGDNVVTLPSFSSWSAHTPFSHYEFMSPVARNARFQTALAILGERLLPVPLRR